MSLRDLSFRAVGEESHTNPISHSVLDTESVNADYSYIKLTNPSLIYWIASKSKIFRNDVFNLQILQIDYSHLMKQRKNSCCLSGSEFTSFELNLVTVFSRRCFSFLSNVLSFFFAIKKKEYLVRGLGLHKPQL